MGVNGTVRFGNTEIERTSVVVHVKTDVGECHECRSNNKMGKKCKNSHYAGIVLKIVLHYSKCLIYRRKTCNMCK